MKKILIGLFLVTSFSAFASPDCRLGFSTVTGSGLGWKRLDKFTNEIVKTLESKGYTLVADNDKSADFELEVELYGSGERYGELVVLKKINKEDLSKTTVLWQHRGTDFALSDALKPILIGKYKRIIRKTILELPDASEACI